MTTDDLDLVEAGANVFLCIVATACLALVGAIVWGLW